MSVKQLYIELVLKNKRFYLSNKPVSEGFLLLNIRYKKQNYGNYSKNTNEEEVKHFRNDWKNERF
jgi:hypothetical protein